MQVQLEAAGHKTAVAGDVPQAPEVLHQEQRDMVISGLNYQQQRPFPTR